MTLLLYETSVISVACAPVADDMLASELRMLCRGLACSSLPFLTTVSTIVRLPGDEEGERTLRQVCGELAAEFGLDPAVRCDGDAWAVCFTRPVAEESAAAGAWAVRWATLLARLAGVWNGLRPAPLVGPETGR